MMVDDAIDAGLDGANPVILHAKMLRLELLKVRAELQRELETWVLNCTKEIPFDSTGGQPIVGGVV